ncbi:hypothetical protein [Chitinophaga solisilvae]|uniref:Lipoprotein n=1 Tax=Chitinophaga solisilvae TaxID=1233460 RepID=A0A9Q5GPH4_9BACT|nr:hypothetical protein [Chitinophaga solisilvae]NSL90980.1 hypothetical protein [Chitinophaga solisilvae]
MLKRMFGRLPSEPGAAAVLLPAMVLFACTAPRQAQQYNFTARGCDPDSLLKQATYIFTKYNLNGRPFKVDVIQTDSFYVIRKYPKREYDIGGSAYIYISRADCKVVRELWD